MKLMTDKKEAILITFIFIKSEERGHFLLQFSVLAMACQWKYSCGSPKRAHFTLNHAEHAVKMMMVVALLGRTLITTYRGKTTGLH